MDDLTIIENGRSDRNYWLDLWRFRELFQTSSLARYISALQTNCHWSTMGGNSPLTHDDDLHNYFWANCQTSVGRLGAICVARSGGDAAMVIFFLSFVRGVEQSSQQREIDHQSLFSTPDHSHR